MTNPELILEAEPDPTGRIHDARAVGASANPFHDGNYARMRGLLGERPWFLGLRSAQGIVTSCSGFSKISGMRVQLEIPSVPATEHTGLFWSSILSFCQRTGVSNLSIRTFASPECKIPTLRGESKRIARKEFLLELKAGDLLLSKNHSRNIARARSHAITANWAEGSCGVDAHVQLVSAARSRRAAHVRDKLQDGMRRTYQAITGEKCGRVFLATKDGRAIASALILLSNTTAYYHSSGTTPEGRSLGAAHLLVSALVDELSRAGLEILNLGGAELGMHGLVRFKSGFGAREVDLESVDCQLGGASIARVFRYLRNRGRSM